MILTFPHRPSHLTVSLALLADLDNLRLRTIDEGNLRNLPAVNKKPWVVLQKHTINAWLKPEFIRLSLCQRTSCVCTQQYSRDDQGHRELDRLRLKACPKEHAADIPKY